jgi:hypothetical protein
MVERIRLTVRLIIRLAVKRIRLIIKGLGRKRLIIKGLGRKRFGVSKRLMERMRLGLTIIIKLVNSLVLHIELVRMSNSMGFGPLVVIRLLIFEI